MTEAGAPRTRPWVFPCGRKPTACVFFLPLPLLPPPFLLSVSVCLSVCVSLHVSHCLCLCVSLCISLFLTVSVCLFASLSLFISLCLTLSVSHCLRLSLSLTLSASPSLSPPSPLFPSPPLFLLSLWSFHHLLSLRPVGMSDPGSMVRVVPPPGGRLPFCFWGHRPSGSWEPSPAPVQGAHSQTQTPAGSPFLEGEPLQTTRPHPAGNGSVSCRPEFWGTWSRIENWQHSGCLDVDSVGSPHGPLLQEGGFR